MPILMEWGYGFNENQEEAVWDIIQGVAVIEGLMHYEGQAV